MALRTGDFPNAYGVETGTIPAGASVSGTITLNWMAPRTIVIPAGFQGGAIRIRENHDGTGATFAVATDEAGNEIQFTVVAGKPLRLTSEVIGPVYAIQVEALAAVGGAAQTQSAARALSVTAAPAGV